MSDREDAMDQLEFWDELHLWQDTGARYAL